VPLWVTTTKRDVRWFVEARGGEHVEIRLYRKFPTPWLVMTLTEEQLDDLAAAIRKFKRSY
jgi:hypothetical protein